MESFEKFKLEKVEVPFSKAEIIIRYNDDQILKVVVADYYGTYYREVFYSKMLFKNMQQYNLGFQMYAAKLSGSLLGLQLPLLNFDIKEIEVKDLSIHLNLMSDLYSQDYIFDTLSRYHTQKSREAYNSPKNTTTKNFKIGCELEIICNSYDELQSLTGEKSNIFSKESDSSLSNNGIELVSIPLAYENAIDVNFWSQFTDQIKMIAHTDSSCGHHIHISKTILNQENTIEHIYRLDNFWNLFIPKDFLLYLFGRKKTYNQFNDGTFGIIKNALGKEAFKVSSLKEKLMKQFDVVYTYDRYRQINFTNSKTIEFRLGAGTINAEIIAARIEFCILLIDFTRDENCLYQKDWADFKEYILANAKNDLLKNNF